MAESPLDALATRLVAWRQVHARQAASDTPDDGVRAACDQLSLSINDELIRYLQRQILAGCTFPSTPIRLNHEDTFLLNFGCSPALMRRELAIRYCEENDLPPPAAGRAILPKSQQRELREALAKLLHTASDAHWQTRVYNLEPWLQEMYRDCLDVDFAEQLRQQIQQKQTYLDSLAKNVTAMGLPKALQAEVAAAFSQFRRIIHQSYMLEHDKSSFTNRRSFAESNAAIESTLDSVEEYLKSHQLAKSSSIREIFGYYRDASYEMMRLNRLLRTTWVGTEMDRRIEDLCSLYRATMATACRCTEEDGHPQCLVTSTNEVQTMLSRQTVVDTLNMILPLRLFGNETLANARMEFRRYGPLCLLLVPGQGHARFSSELREAHDQHLQQRQKNKARDFDFSRRLRYSLNLLVVPLTTPKERLLEDLTGAWLEYRCLLHPGAYKDFLNEVRSALPSIFEVEEGMKSGSRRQRRILLRYLTDFIRWSHTGRESTLPEFAKFRQWLASRQQTPTMVVHPRYRSLLLAFADAGDSRKEEFFLAHLRDFYRLNHQLLVVHALRYDWQAFVKATRWLSSSERDNRLLSRVYELAQASPDHRTDRRIENIIDNYFQNEPELQYAFLQIKSTINRSLVNLHSKIRKRGQTSDPEQLYQRILNRQHTQLQAALQESLQTVDFNLAALLYASDGNYPAAIHFLEQHRQQTAPAESSASAPQRVVHAKRKLHIGDEPDSPAFPQYGRSEQDEFALYNLAQFHLKVSNAHSAIQCLTGFMDATEGRHHLLRLQAAQLRESLKAAESEEKSSKDPSESDAELHLIGG